ncbi:MAG: hypothetical protein WEA09_01755 [Gemmatimonadota bacterium]
MSDRTAVGDSATFGREPLRIDVGGLVERSVTSLYAHLVTRPTGRAVRSAIEAQVEERGKAALSLIDLSEVTVLDFSCADEVVAKLLMRFSRPPEPPHAYFIFRGVAEAHLDPIEAVLERHDLTAVGETEPGRYRLLGPRQPIDEQLWGRLEGHGRVPAGGVEEWLAHVLDDDAKAAHDAMERLLVRGLVFRSRGSGDLLALSALAVGLPGGPAPDTGREEDI